MIFLVPIFQIFYETVKSCVEEAFGACHAESSCHVVQDDMQLFDLPDISRVIFSCLDDLTNKGLYLLAIILTGDRVNFEKTRWKMKKVVRESLQLILQSQNHNHYHLEISSKVSQLLSDPRSFRHNCVPFVTSRSQTHHAAAIKVLDGLGDLPCQTLIAMHRKLKGRQSIPQLKPPRTGWNRDHLINQVKKTSEKMLSNLGKGDKLKEPLAKAMSIAGLSLKLTPGFHNSPTTEFHEISPKIKILQNEITKAIWLVQRKIRMPELKKIQLLLDPTAKVTNRSLRKATMKMLTEYLFECSDMDTIPKSLLETLATINRSSRSSRDKSISKDKIEEEVECILKVSAQSKQILWDLLPDHNFDIDFTEAYMADLEESDDDENGGLQEDRISQNSNHSFDSSDEVESIGDFDPIDLDLPTATTNMDDSCPVQELKPNFSSGIDSVDICEIKRDLNSISSKRYESKLFHEMDLTNTMRFFPFKLLFGEPKDSNASGTTYSNQYLAIQDVCDKTSVVAYNLVGHMLKEFTRMKGLDLDWRDDFYLRHNFPDEDDSEGIETTFSNLVYMHVYVCVYIHTFFGR